MIHPTPHDVGRRVVLAENPDEDGELGTLQGIGDAYAAVRLDGDAYDRVIRLHRLSWWAPSRRTLATLILGLLGAQPATAPPQRRRHALFARSAP